jgi:ribosomal RNA assembly protein
MIMSSPPARKEPKNALTATENGQHAPIDSDSFEDTYSENIVQQSLDDPFGAVSYEIRIPKARIAVLIGTGGEVKKRIEEETKTKITVDSVEGEALISGTDVVTSYIVKDIIKAIGRGFNPDIALLLLKSDYAFELIEMHELAKHKNQLLRVKGRIIGKGGRTRQTIEETMDVNMSVFGKTIGIIGQVEHVLAAKQAVEMLLDGSPHANVYRWLEKKKKSFVREELANAPLELKDGMDKYVRNN